MEVGRIESTLGVSRMLASSTSALGPLKADGGGSLLHRAGAR